MNIEKDKYMIIRCIYSTPGSSIEAFRAWMEEMFSKTSQKVFFDHGDVI